MLSGAILPAANRSIAQRFDIEVSRERPASRPEARLWTYEHERRQRQLRPEADTGEKRGDDGVADESATRGLCFLESYS